MPFGVSPLQLVKSRAAIVTFAAAALVLIAWLQPTPRVAWRVPEHLQDEIDHPGRHRTVSVATLIVSERPYTTAPSPNDTVPWSSDSLLGSSTPLRITGWPRSAVLNADAPSESDLLFVFTTNFKRATTYGVLWNHFLSQSSQCFILLPPDDADNADELRNHLRTDIGLPCSVRISQTDRYEDRVGTVVQEAVAHAADTGKPFQWLMIGDDDTFWLDMRTTRRMLSKYDHRRDWFIGGVTEAVAQFGAFGRQAYGGAGIVISQSLVEKMASRFPDCLKAVEGVWTGGDGVLTYCAALVTNVDHADVLTEELGMHQMDVPGDGSGFFQSGLPFITAHHYVDGWIDFVPKSWPESHSGDRPAIDIIGRTVKAIGGDNMFRRYIFDDGKTLLTMGYSVTRYEQALAPDDLAKMEYTWSYDGYDMRFPQRPNIPEGSGKTSYYILDSFDAGTDAQGRDRTRLVFSAQDGRNVSLLLIAERDTGSARGSL